MSLTVDDIKKGEKFEMTRRIILLTIAIMRLEAGPAKEMIALSLLGSRRLNGSNGTGLPQPNPAKRRSSVPIGSKCARGLSVSLPISLAVGSPR